MEEIDNIATELDMTTRLDALRDLNAAIQHIRYAIDTLNAFDSVLTCRARVAVLAVEYAKNEILPESLRGATQ